MTRKKHCFRGAKQRLQKKVKAFHSCGTKTFSQPFILRYVVFFFSRLKSTLCKTEIRHFFSLSKEFTMNVWAKYVLSYVLLMKIQATLKCAKRRRKKKKHTKTWKHYLIIMTLMLCVEYTFIHFSYFAYVTIENYYIRSLKSFQ